MGQHPQYQVDGCEAVQEVEIFSISQVLRDDPEDGSPAKLWIFPTLICDVFFGSISRMKNIDHTKTQEFLI